MSHEKDTPSLKELRARAINGVESYQTGYRHGIAESEQDLGLAKLTIEQLKTRIANQDLHIEMLEATIRRITSTEEITDPKAMGYRPPSCDHASGVMCCSQGRCAADDELREMGRSINT